MVQRLHQQREPLLKAQTPGHEIGEDAYRLTFQTQVIARLDTLFLCW
jgi:hypothetical protein